MRALTRASVVDGEIVGVVDGRLGAQGAVFLVILLDASVPVINIEGRGDVLSDDAGTGLWVREDILRLKMSRTSSV